MRRPSPVIAGSPLANAALVAALEESGEWDEIVSGHGLRFTPTRQLGQPTVPQPFYIPPFDTSSFIDPPEPEAKLEPENGDKPTYPAAPAKRRLKWLRESEAK